MKAITKVTPHKYAEAIVSSLKSAGIYSCISGTLNEGYEVLVNDAQEKQARDLIVKGNN